MSISNLVYWQRLELRNKICNIKIEDVSEHDNYLLQGNLMKKLGFTEYESHYPDDTWVGNLRLKGWQDAK